jgi:putative hydrolase of the HAD superfamily
MPLRLLKKADTAHAEGLLIVETITTLFLLFLDMGKVLLTDSWGPAMRQSAVERFGFDFAEVAERSRLTFEVYEEGRVTLDQFLDWVVFDRERPFSRHDLTQFMLAQSQPHPEMIDLMRTLKRRYGLRMAVVTNDGREFAEYRIQRFGLAEFIDFFIVSCFVHRRKPDPEIYRIALDVGQISPSQVLYLDDQPMFVEVAIQLGMHGIHHIDYDTTRAQLATYGLSPAE